MAWLLLLLIAGFFLYRHFARDVRTAASQLTG